MQHSTDGRSPIDSDEGGETMDDELTCSTCGTAVPEGARSCPVCHRGIYRTCYCGWRLPANERTCPNCGADWSQSARVARKSRSRSLNTQKLLRHAIYGAVIATAATAMILLIVGFLAQLGLGADDGALPRSTGDRLALAVAGVARLGRLIGGFFLRHGTVILSMIGVMAVGAGAGIVVYLRRSGRSTSHKSRTSRRVRRKRQSRST